jgi:uncharacterized membrane protein YfcA
VTTTASLVVLAGAFAGGFASGLTGFGLGLVALGIWLHAIGPAEAATLVAICSVSSQLQTIPSVWQHVDRARVGPMIAAGLLGVPLGTWLLTRIDPDAFRIGAGILLVAFSGLMLVLRAQPALAWGGHRANGAVGFLGGVMGGLAGLSGPPPILWATLRGWSKAERRGVFQAFNLSILAATAVVHLGAQWAGGLAQPSLGWHLLVALPGTFVGAWLGFRAYLRLSDRGFHRVVLALLLVSGLGLIVPHL